MITSPASEIWGTGRASVVRRASSVNARTGALPRWGRGETRHWLPAPESSGGPDPARPNLDLVNRGWMAPTFRGVPRGTDGNLARAATQRGHRLVEAVSAQDLSRGHGTSTKVGR